MRTVAALFVLPDSVYKSLPGVECFDAQRDAQTFAGGCPVVAHPPCRTWGRLRPFAKAPPEEHDYAPWAVTMVRQHGGVLEHPSSSTLWGACTLPLPGEPPDLFGGRTIEVDQFHFGHRARKRTWLYVVGFRRLPPLPHRAGKPTRVISTRKKIALPEVTKREREATPVAFAKWLVRLARACGRRREP